MLQSSSYGKAAIGRFAIGVVAALSGIGITVAQADDSLVGRLKKSTLSWDAPVAMFAENGGWKPTHFSFDPRENKLAANFHHFIPAINISGVQLHGFYGATYLSGDKLHNPIPVETKATNTAEQVKDQMTGDDANKSVTQRLPRTSDKVSGTFGHAGVKASYNVTDSFYVAGALSGGAIFPSKSLKDFYFGVSVGGSVGYNGNILNDGISFEGVVKGILPFDASVNNVYSGALRVSYTF